MGPAACKIPVFRYRRLQGCRVSGSGSEGSRVNRVAGLEAYKVEASLRVLSWTHKMLPYTL